MSTEYRKKRVLHLIEGLGSGGAERLLHTNLKYIDKTEFDHEVVTVFSERDFWKEPLEDLGVPVSSLDCKNLRSILTGVHRLRRHIRANRPDLIHTHLWAANIIGRATGGLDSIPVVSSIHGPEYEEESKSDASARTRISISAAQLLDRATARLWCRRMVAVSSFVKRSTVKRIGYPEEKIDVVYNPVEIRGSISATSNPFEEDGIPSEKTILLGVGRVVSQKGFLYAVRAMPAVLSEFPDAHLVLIGNLGDDRYVQLLKDEMQRSRISDNVHLLGERRGIVEYLRNCDVFVFPSVFEGMGIALAEAMLAGCACVISRIEPFGEFVIDGVSGVFFESRDPESLAQRLKELIRDSAMRLRLGESAKNAAEKKFEPENAGKALASIYKSVLGE